MQKKFHLHKPKRYILLCRFRYDCVLTKVLKKEDINKKIEDNLLPKVKKAIIDN